MDVAQAIVASVAATKFELGFSGGQVQFIMGDQHFIRIDLEKVRQRAYRFTRQVHKGLRLQKPQRLPLKIGARHQPVVAAVHHQRGL